MGLLDGLLDAALGGGQQQGNTQAALLQAVISMMTNKQGDSSAGGLGGLLGGVLGSAQQGGGLGDMLGGLLGGGQQANSQMAGGLGNLIDMLSQLGLGQQVNSWIGTGENQAVSANDIQNALGQNGTLSKIAQQAGVTEQDAAGGLAELLPNLINQLTPNGKIDTNDITSILGKLMSK